MTSLESIRALIKEERFQSAYEQLAQDASLSQSPEGARLLGLICVRMGKHAEGAKYYDLVCAKSNESSDWFNLAISRLQGGDAVAGIIAIEEAKRRYKNKDEMSVPMMLFYFIGGLLDAGMWDAAKRYLLEVADVYAKLARTDDTYLYTCGVPYFSWFLNAAATAYRNARSPREGVNWLTSLAAKVDPAGKEKINRTIRMLSDHGLR